jgi:hypothetical protein
MCRETAQIVESDLTRRIDIWDRVFNERKTKICDDKNMLFIRVPLVLTFLWQVILFLA